jgi:hypothetical protein
MAEEPVPQHAEAEPPVPLAPRQPRPVDRLASDQPARETAPFASREPQPPGAAAEAVFSPAADHNSAETTERLVEAVLGRYRKPRPDAELRSGLTPSPETQSDSQPASDAEGLARGGATYSQR